MAAAMGRDGFVSFGDGGATDGTTESVAYLDSWTLNASIGTAEVSPYGADSKEFLQTLRDATVTAAGTLDKGSTEQEHVLSHFDTTTHGLVYLRLYDSTSFWLLKAYATGVTVGSNVGDKVAVSYTFQGTSNLDYITT